MALKSIFAVVSHGINALFSNLRNRSTATSLIVRFQHDYADLGPDLHDRFREGSLCASVAGMGANRPTSWTDLWDVFRLRPMTLASNR